ncbi:MAG: conjugative transfer signal peptidase TraF [Rhodopila sp.]|jgi:conjugative transfer signal peptidase TraF
MKLLLPATVFGALAFGSFSLDLRWNASPSMPIGLWRVTTLHRIERGQAVAVCLPEAAARLGVARGYLDAGDCPGHAEVLIKTLAAIPGDQVVVSDSGTAINGDLIPNSRPLAQDDAGRPLTANAGTFIVGEGQAWIVSSHDARSYDSRYAGPVRLTDIRGIATPVLVATK